MNKILGINVLVVLLIWKKLNRLLIINKNRNLIIKQTLLDYHNHNKPQDQDLDQELILCKKQLDKYNKVRTILNFFGNLVGVGYVGYWDVTPKMEEYLINHGASAGIFYNFKYKYLHFIKNIYNENVNLGTFINEQCVYLLDAFY